MRVIENKVRYVINLHYLLEHLVVIYGQQTTYKMVQMDSLASPCIFTGSFACWYMNIVLVELLQ